MYHAYPPHTNSSDKAIIHLTDIFGVPLLENKLYNPTRQHPLLTSRN
jgi:hypothetical protein